MRTGGASDKSLKSYIITTKEILNSIKIIILEIKFLLY